MFLLVACEPVVSFCVALGLIVSSRGGKINSDTTTVVDKIVAPFCFVFPFPCFLFLHPWGEGKKKGVTYS